MQVEGMAAVAGRKFDLSLTVETEFGRGAECHLATPQGDAGLRGYGLQIGVEVFVENSCGFTQPDCKLRLFQVFSTLAQAI